MRVRVLLAATVSAAAGLVFSAPIVHAIYELLRRLYPDDEVRILDPSPFPTPTTMSAVAGAAVVLALLVQLEIPSVRRWSWWAHLNGGRWHVQECWAASTPASCADVETLAVSGEHLDATPVDEIQLSDVVGPELGIASTVSAVRRVARQVR